MPAAKTPKKKTAPKKGVSSTKIVTTKTPNAQAVALIDVPLAERRMKRAAEEAVRVLEHLQNLKIETADQYESACVFLKSVKDHYKEFDAERKASVDPLNKEVKRINGNYKAPLTSLELATKQLENKLELFRAQQRQLAAKTAEKEAAAYEKAGLTDMAEDVRSMVLAKAVPQIAGQTVREYWSAELDDLNELVQAVAAGKYPLEALQANEVYLNGQARATKDASKAPPGVRFVSREGTSG